MRSDDATSLSDPSIQETVRQIVGQVVSRVDRLYGGAISFHIGPMIAGRRRDRGTWVVTAWGADLLVNDVPLELETETATTLHPEVEQLKGQRVLSASVEADTRELRLTFEQGSSLRLSPDGSFNGDAWNLSLPDGRTLCVSSDGVGSVKTEDSAR